MGSTIVTIKTFEDRAIVVKDQPQKVVVKKSFEEVVIVVPGDGEEEAGIFDFTFDNSFE